MINEVNVVLTETPRGTAVPEDFIRSTRLRALGQACGLTQDRLIGIYGARRAANAIWAFI